MPSSFASGGEDTNEATSPKFEITVPNASPSPSPSASPRASLPSQQESPRNSLSPNQTVVPTALSPPSPSGEKKKKSIKRKISVFFGIKKDDKDEKHSTLGRSHTLTSPPSPLLNFTKPMPEDPDEVETMFQNAVAQMGIQSAENRNIFMSRHQTLEQKWEFVVTMEKSHMQLLSGIKSNTDFYITFFNKEGSFADPKYIKESRDTVQGLGVQLRSQKISWLEEFVKKDGLYYLTTLLASMLQWDNHDDLDNLHQEVIICYNTLLNVEIGIAAFLDQPDAIRTMVLSLDGASVKNRSTITLLLALLCHHSEEALLLTLDAFSHYRLVKREPQRFKSLVDSIFSTKEIQFKINCLMFINALLNTPNDPNLRSQLQQEFLNFDLLKRLQDLDSGNDEFLTQIGEFEEELKQDFNDHFQFKNSSDPAQIISVLHTQLAQENKVRLLQVLNDFIAISNVDTQTAQILDNNWTTTQRVVRLLVGSMDESGKIKDLSEEAEKLKTHIKTQQFSMSELEEKIKNEKSKIVQYLTGGEPPIKEEEFELTREIVALVQNLRANGGALPTTPVIAVDAPTGPPPPPPPGPPGPPPPIGGGPPPPPPPPGMGGPPGPPPPPGMGGMNAGPQLPKLPNYVPKGNLRNFHIVSISKPKLQKSVFVKEGIAEGTANIKLNVNELENLFGVMEKTPSGSDVTQPVQQVISLIDSKRAYNVGIQLASLRMPFPAIKENVINMNETKISQNQLNVLRAIAPTGEEIDTVKGYDGDLKFLAEPDKFFLEMKNIPLIRDRLDCWAFKLRFEGDVSSLKPDIEAIRLGAREMQKSEKLFQFLTIVLAVSNYLNAKSRYKNSYGFKLDSLAKLKDTKTSDGKSNLLCYLIEFVEKNYPQLEKFYEDLPNVILAKRVALSTVKETMNTLSKALNQLQKTIDMYEALGDDQKPQGDKFIAQMKPFYDKAKHEFESVEEKLNTATKSLEVLVELYDEDKTLIQKPEDFFKKVDEFLELYKTTKSQLVEKRIKEEERKKKEKKNATPDIVVAKPTSAHNKPQIGMREMLLKSKVPNKNILSDLESDLRSGRAFKSKRENRLSMRLNEPVL